MAVKGSRLHAFDEHVPYKKVGNLRGTVGIN